MPAMRKLSTAWWRPASASQVCTRSVVSDDDIVAVNLLIVIADGSNNYIIIARVGKARSWSETVK